MIDVQLNFEGDSSIGRQDLLRMKALVENELSRVSCPVHHKPPIRAIISGSSVASSRIDVEGCCGELLKVAYSKLGRRVPVYDHWQIYPKKAASTHELQQL